MLQQAPDNIIISRTDSIGDVVLTLPVAGALKRQFPQMKIAFMGKAYTRPVIEACEFVDEFIDIHDFMQGEITVGGQKPQCILHVLPVSEIAFRARKLGIPLRIGTTNRSYHWFTCNKLIKLSRKNSPFHEAQLNLRLLDVFGIRAGRDLQEIPALYGLHPQALEDSYKRLLDEDRYNIILHPKSQGHGREWPLEHFITLVKTLDPHRFRIFVSGTKKEKERLQPLFDQVGGLVNDITGLMELGQFMAFIKAADGLIASGTGPIHLAAALGRDAYGLFPGIRPVHPGRWAPLGPGASVFVLKEDCNDCRKSPADCACMKGIEPMLLKAALDRAAASRQPVAR